VNRTWHVDDRTPAAAVALKLYVMPREVALVFWGMPVTTTVIAPVLRSALLTFVAPGGAVIVINSFVPVGIDKQVPKICAEIVPDLRLAGVVTE